MRATLIVLALALLVGLPEATIAATAKKHNKTITVAVINPPISHRNTCHNGRFEDFDPDPKVHLQIVRDCRHWDHDE